MHERNLPHLHRHQAARLGDRPAVRWRALGVWHDLTHARYRADALACAAALVEAGIQPGDRVGLLAENRVEWLIADMGLMTAGAVNVPPHAPLTGPQVQFQLADSGARWLFLSTQAQLDKMLPLLPQLPAIQGVVVFEASGASDGPGPSREHADWTGAITGPARRSLLTWEGFLQRGRQALAKHAAELARREAALAPDDLATVMYTSGTTGNPKGVMLTHANLLSNVASVLASEPYTPDDVQLCWLPFSHIYARTMDHYRMLHAGCLLALADSVDTVLRDLGEIQPTHMNSVPRLYEKVLTAVSGPDRAASQHALRHVFGPRLRMLCSGGAPLPVAVAQAYHDAGILLLQGYGLTESSPVISFNRSTCYKIDSVGPALEGVEVRIANDGEVLSRGPHIMKGYWNNPAATAETIRDGWLHTGDLGSLDAAGFLHITGRKKELMVMSNGKKVVPAQIEGLLIADPCIDQAVVHGEGKNFLTALIVPHWENLRKEVPGLPTADAAELSAHAAVYTFLQARLDAALRDLASWERVKKFVVLAEPFSVANDELTVSLKLRRNVVLTRYGERLDALYRE